MKEEKNSRNIIWFAHDTIRLRVKKEQDGLSVIWATKDFKNLILPLVLSDFIYRSEQELHLDIDIDKSWDGHRGFKVKNDDVNLLLGEIISFTARWDVEVDKHCDSFTSQQWYSE